MKNIIFDLDGTLANTLPLCIRAFQEALEPLTGRALSDEEIVATFGPTEEGTVAAFLPEMKAEGLTRYLERYQALHSMCPELFDGMRDVLRFLKRKNAFVALVTAKGQESTEYTLDEFGLRDYFDVVKTGSASGPIKDICIEEIIREFSLARDETLYVGDSPIDIIASRDCRIKVVAAAWAPTANEEVLRSMQPDYLYNSVRDFFLFLSRLFEGERQQPTINRCEA